MLNYNTSSLSQENITKLSNLQIQSVAIILLIYSNVLGLTATLQSIELINNPSKESSKYTPNPDATAVTSASFGFYGQTLLTQLTSINYYNSTKSFNANSKDTNLELYIADFLFSIAYSFSVIGSKKLLNFNTHTPSPIIGI